jgi:hypothetical protein
MAAALNLYALVVALGPFLHHDLACHLKSRTHCTSCVVGASVSSDPGGAALASLEPAEAGLFTSQDDPRPRSAVMSRAHGRSPPA